MKINYVLNRNAKIAAINTYRKFADFLPFQGKNFLEIDRKGVTSWTYIKFFVFLLLTIDIHI
ncbi:MAG: hypothetical protein DRN37_03255 [Thermoplasmata archaeon]|nr:MAG: hypothetical protein DRH50_04105 [Deltaproteobacteria bacterium]RLF60068.1 MAG: hypothetical protein DRN37_03255 [Thermoplasmata archaeon]